MKTKAKKARAELNPKSIEGMKIGEWASHKDTRGDGVLQARKLARGRVAYYYRYTGPDGKRVRLALAARELVAARDEARKLGMQRREGSGDVREEIATKKREEEAARQSAKAAAEAKAARAQATLGALLEAYCAHLKHAGKVRHREVAGCIDKHVKTPWPSLWATPAADIGVEDLVAVVGHVVDAGKRPQAKHLRSYLRAAYSAAIEARQAADGFPALRNLRLSANPVRDLAPVKGASKTRERTLTGAELRAYWIRIKEGDDFAVLRFHLLTGAQRVAQLRRAELADIDHDARALMLRDPKGRRTTPRKHAVPLSPEADTDITTMRRGALGPFVFTVTHGKHGITNKELNGRMQAVGAAMVKDGEIAEPFTHEVLRRTVETRLSALGVSKEVRGHLQSHGLGGVQARHYDRHDYLAEKRAALELLRGLLEPKSATVTPIRRKTKRA